MKTNCAILFASVLWAIASPALAVETVITDFETIPVPYDSFQTARGPFPDGQTSGPGPFGGIDTSGTFTVDRLTVNNTRNTPFDSFTGFAASQRPLSLWSNSATGFEGFFSGNDTVSANGIGDLGSSSWLVSFGSGAGILQTDGVSTIDSVAINNTATTADVLQNGNSAAVAFGSRLQDELFTVRFVDLSAGSAGDFVEAELASYDLASDELTILTDWTTIDLTSLDSNRIGIEFTSTDAGGFGINTPTYVAVDSVAVTSVPEPASIAAGLFGGVLFARRRRRRKPAAA